jgi:hypothetical protein
LLPLYNIFAINAIRIEKSRDIFEKFSQNAADLLKNIVNTGEGIENIPVKGGLT